MSLQEKVLEVASRGDAAEIRKLLATGQVGDHDKTEALLSAAEEGHADVVVALIEAETDLAARDYEGFSAVALAASKGHGAVAEMLEAAGAAADGLVWAAGITGREALLDRAIGRKEDVRRCTEDGWTALHYAAKEGHERIAARLLSLGAELDAEDRQNRTPLSVAAHAGHLGMVKALADRGADVNRALVAAAAGGHHDVVRECIARGAAIDTRDNYAETALHKAAENGDEALAKLLMEHRATIDRPSINRTTPLMQAANRGHTGVVKLLLQRGAAVNQTTDVQETALSYAARWGHVETLETLLGAGAIILGSGRYNPLVVAAREGHPAAARRLLEAGADVNYEYDGETALSGAARQGNVELVTLLLEHGATIEDNAVSEAAERGHAEIVQLLFDRGAALPEGFMHKAAEGGRAELVSLALKRGCSAHERGGYWERTPLAVAAAAGSVEAVRVLLDAGADPNTTDRDGKTAVRLATERDAQDVVRLLEARGALKERPQLFTAAARGDASTVEVMLAEKANPSVRVKGRTPLHEASALGHIDAVRALLIGKASPDLTDDDGWTPLMDACDFGHLDVATALLDANADPFVADRAEYTAYRLAVRGEHKDIAALFERRDIDRDWRPDLARAAREGDLAALEKLEAKGRPLGLVHEGESILHAAASAGQLSVVVLALESGVPADQRDSSGRTAVFRAATEGHTEIVRELLARGADPRAADSYDTALGTAAANGYTGVVRALLEAGAPAGMKDAQGRRAIDRALEYDQDETALALLELGTDVDDAVMKAALKRDPRVVTALVEKGLRLPGDDSDARKLALTLWAQGVGAEFDDPVEALLDSVAYDDIDVVKGLLDKGLDVNAADEDGTTPLLKARSRGDKAIEKLLKKKGAKALGVLLDLARSRTDITAKVVKAALADGDRVDLADSEGRTALHWAAKHGEAKAVKALVAAKAPLDALTKEGRTPLLFALEGDHWDAADLLIDAGADVALGPEEEWSAAAHYLRAKKLDRAKALVKAGSATKWLMHAAAGSGSLEAIAFAMASGASAEIATATGWNAARAAAASGERAALDEVLRLGSPRAGVLHGAAASGKVELVKYALDLGADAKAKDGFGRTALHEAAFTTSDVVEALLDAGADPNIPDEDGWTPLFMACDQEDVDVIKLFIARGANVGHANARGETVIERARWGSDEVKKALGISERSSYGGYGDDDED